MIYDITQELLSGSVYPGDISPCMEHTARIADGDSCNLNNLTFCLHNGTHVDAPSHFIEGGKTVDALDLEKMSGKATVISFAEESETSDSENDSVKEAENGRTTAITIDKNDLIPVFARRKVKRLLLKGNIHLTEDAARLCSQEGLYLIGTENKSLDTTEDYPVHKILLGSDIVILENLNLSEVPDGSYLLHASPLSILGAEASPVRAVLETYHGAPKMTTLCYIRKDDQYLMLLRNKKKEDINEGKWIGVGGRAEEGESPDDCILREVREETGLTLTDYRLRGIITFISDEWEEEYMMLYEGLSFTGELLRDCVEGTLRWVPTDEIFSLSLWDGDRIFLKEMLETDHFINLKFTYEGNTLADVVTYHSCETSAV